MLIDIQNLSYSISGNSIIKNLSFLVQEKKIVSIIGYNGSGKSTLLKLILGNIKPTSGKIVKKAGLNIGYVPQKLSFTHQIPITVSDFIDIYNPKRKKAGDLILGSIDIASLFNKPLSGLSGGQLQKILIYNALLGNPNVLLLDEPTAGLDVLAQQEFYDLIDRIHSEYGVTILLVSHDMHTVYSKSDEILCLHKGLCCSGVPDDTKFSEEVLNLFDGYVLPYLHTHTSHDG